MNEIKIVESPSVYLLSEPKLNLNELSEFLEKNKVKWFRKTELDADTIAEIIGRLKEANGFESRSDFLPILDQCYFTFIIEGISQSFTQKILESNLFSVSVLSQSFTEDAPLSFVLPMKLKESYQTFKTRGHRDTAKEVIELDEKSRSFLLWRDSCLFSISFYKDVLNRLTASGVDKDKAKEAASNILPNCLESKLAITGNLLEWRKAIITYCNEENDTEESMVLNQIYSALVSAMPNYFLL